MKIEVRYFALLSEQAGRHAESLSFEGTLAELYAALSLRHGFTLPLRSVRAAVNDDFVEWERPVAEGDVVVFIPPVSGG